MIEFLTRYSAWEIVIFFTFALVFLKEVFELAEFFKSRILKVTDKGYELQNDKITLYSIAEQIEKITRQLQLLTESDKDDIKGWIVEKYNFYKKNPDAKIDAFTMDTLEKRYSHYKDEGGNSYITEIMNDLRQRAKED